MDILKLTFHVVLCDLIVDVLALFLVILDKSVDLMDRHYIFGYREVGLIARSRIFFVVREYFF